MFQVEPEIDASFEATGDHTSNSGDSGDKLLGTPGESHPRGSTGVKVTQKPHETYSPQGPALQKEHYNSK